LQQLGLKKESYPFDWIVSNLAVVRHCIETDFAEFMNPVRYVARETLTANHLDGRVTEESMETPEVNTFYCDQARFEQVGGQKKVGGQTRKDSTYWLPLAATHHSFINKAEDVEYFGRCVERFRRLTDSPIKKRYLYIHPFIGVYEYDRHKTELKGLWDEFSRYLGWKLGDARGVFIVPVFVDKGGECRDAVWEELFRTKWGVGWKVEISYWGFRDSGKTFGGDHELELRQIEARVRAEFLDDIEPGLRADLESEVLR
jgi:hypothetical protein